MTIVIFGRFEIGLFTDDGRYLSHGRKIVAGDRDIRRQKLRLIRDKYRYRMSINTWNLPR